MSVRDSFYISYRYGGNTEMSGILIWMVLAPILLLCEFIVGIFLIVAGIKYRKSLTIIAGLISILLIVVPIICIGFGIDLEGMVPISGTLYWCLLLFSWTISYYKWKTNNKYSFYGDNFVYNRIMLFGWLSSFISHSLKNKKAGKLIPCFSIWFIA